MHDVIVSGMLNVIQPDAGCGKGNAQQNEITITNMK